MEELVIPQFKRKWVRPVWQPNMSRKARRNVVYILESGLLFREDSLNLEEWLCSLPRAPLRSIIIPSRGEKIAAVVGIAVCVAAIPLTLPVWSRQNVGSLACYCGMALSPYALRLLAPSALPALLQASAHYTRVSRRYTTSKCWLPIEGVSSALLLQQRLMCRTLLGADAALLSAFPWLGGPRATGHWEHSPEVNDVINSDDLSKIHHLFLVVQSTFLKNVALAHFPPSTYGARVSDGNEKLYWLHTKLLPTLTQPYINCSISLENAYRYYKESVINRDTKLALPRSVNNNRDPWQYSEVHGCIGEVGSNLRVALIKCNEMDSFLEACWTAKSKFSPVIIEEDLARIRDNLLKCFATIECTSIKLKKIKTAEMKLLEAAVQRLPLPSVQEEECDPVNIKVVSEETPLSIEDQVFYYEKTDETEIVNNGPNAHDYLTGPGKKEIDTTKIVLDELKVVLVKREDEMRAREAKALENTMPELKGKIPEFPRQIMLNKSKENNEESTLIKNGEESALIKNGEESTLIKNGEESTLIKNGQLESAECKAVGKCSEDSHPKKNNKPLNGQCSSKENLNGGSCDNHYYEEKYSSAKALQDFSKGDIAVELQLGKDIKSKDNECVRKSTENLECEIKEELVVNNDIKDCDTKSKQSNLNNVPLSVENTLGELNGKAATEGTNVSSDEQNLILKLKQNVDSVNQVHENMNSLLLTEQIKSENSHSTDVSKDEDTNGTNESNAKNLDEEFFDDGLTDSDSEKDSNNPLLHDIRKNRISRKKKYPPSRNESLKLAGNEQRHEECSKESESDTKKNDFADEGLRPVEYSFGTGLAMASLLQIPQGTQGKVSFPSLGAEETFAGSGEVSEDSGNEN